MEKYNNDFYKTLIIKSNDGGNEYFDIIKFKDSVDFKEIEKIVDKYESDFEYYETMIEEINKKYKIVEIISSGVVPTLYF